MLKSKGACVERAGGSAIPVTMANASQTGVKGIVSEALKQTFIKTCIMM
jgi:hypothetical protein